MNPRVLLVDDEAPIALVLSATLRAHGYDVEVAETGEAALSAVARLRPAVMLLDVNLPDLTGWEVLRRLDAADRAAVPVVVFSASPLAASRVREFEPAGVLVKPFPIDALLRLVGGLAGGRVNEEQGDG